MEGKAGPPKVLVISANPFSEIRNNGKTLASFFADWPKESLAQLYFYTDLPTFSICYNYFRITDFDILRNKGLRSSNCGSKISRSSESLISIAASRIPCYKWIANSEFARLLREFLWLSGAWDSEALWQWVDTFSPEIIYFAAGGNAFQYRIARGIAARRNIPVVVLLGDDYFLPRLSVSPAYWIRLAWLRRSLIGLCQSPGTLTLTLCQEMSRAYKAIFNISSTVVPYSIALPDTMPPAPPPDPTGTTRMLFLGGLHLNRWKTLWRLGQCIAKCSAFGTKIRLEIYCQENPGPKILKKLTIPGFSSYCGSLTSEQVAQKLLEGDILVHVESFDYVNRMLTKLSMSTKIPEYLSSARCILAIGPEEVASIRYLKDCHSAIVVTSPKETSLIKALMEIVVDPARQRQLRERAWATAVDNHNLIRTRPRLRALLCDLVGRTGQV